MQNSIIMKKKKRLEADFRWFSFREQAAEKKPATGRGLQKQCWAPSTILEFYCSVIAASLPEGTKVVFLADKQKVKNKNALLYFQRY